MNPATGQFADAARQHIALQRYAHPREVAIAFLASDEAAYITGASLLIDGGYSA